MPDSSGGWTTQGDIITPGFTPLLTIKPEPQFGLNDPLVACDNAIEHWNEVTQRSSDELIKAEANVARLKSAVDQALAKRAQWVKAKRVLAYPEAYYEARIREDEQERIARDERDRS